MTSSSVISKVAFGLFCLVFSMSALAQEISTNELIAIDKRNDFLQLNFSKFVPVQFQKGTNSEAAIQVLAVRTNIFSYDGDYYCGLKFTVPDWLDGDFEWLFLVALHETNKDFGEPNISWYIVPEIGRSQGFESYNPFKVSNFPKLKKQFPFTSILRVQGLDRDRLIPGKTYGIWFRFAERDFPDIAFAVTIRSERGAREFGGLPLQ